MTGSRRKAGICRTRLLRWLWWLVLVAVLVVQVLHLLSLVRAWQRHDKHTSIQVGVPSAQHTASPTCPLGTWQLRHMESTEFPAVTVCSTNPFRLSKLAASPELYNLVRAVRAGMGRERGEGPDASLRIPGQLGLGAGISTQTPPEALHRLLLRLLPHGRAFVAGRHPQLLPRLPRSSSCVRDAIHPTLWPQAGSDGTIYSNITGTGDLNFNCSTEYLDELCYEGNAGCNATCPQDYVGTLCTYTIPTPTTSAYYEFYSATLPPPTARLLQRLLRHDQQLMLL